MKRNTPPLLSGAKPFVGHALEFRKDRAALCQRAYKELGSVSAIKLATKNTAILIGPELHKKFFTETDKSLDMSKPYHFLKPMFGEVLFVAPREAYLAQRPILLEAFKRDKMLQYVGVMQEVVQSWLDSLEDEGSLELTSEINRLVQEVAGTAIMGRAFQAAVGEEFWHLYSDLSKGLDPIIPPNLPLPKFIKRDRARKKMFNILKPILAERRKNPGKYSDFFQDMINKSDQLGMQNADEILMGLVIGLMFAGHETTSGQAAWTLIQLWQHKDYLELVRDEIRTMLPPDRPIDTRLLGKLHHIKWAVEETSRMKPSADMLLRSVEKDIEIKGYHIPKGWLALVTAEVAHFLPSQFSCPHHYHPQRFSPEQKEHCKHRFSLIGFGGGTHKCTGMNFANYEMMIITALMLQQFDWHLETTDPKVERNLGASRPQKTWVKYRRINAKPDLF